MSDAIERPKTYEEGLRDGFRKGQEEANKLMEQMLHTSCNPIVYAFPETEAIKLLQAQIQKMKCCSNCNHFNKESDIEYCQNCERQLVNSLDNFPGEEIIKDEWELRR